MKSAISTFLVLLFLLSARPAHAAAPTEPNPATNPVLVVLQQGGAKFFYLGNRSGMDGWFIVKDGQVQIAYATPDNKSAVVGALFGENGDNVTAQQVAALVRENKDVAQLIMAAQAEQNAISQAGKAPVPLAKAPAAGTIPSAALSPGERLIQDLSSASTVVVGKSSSPELLMVMDPRCPHCQATWKALRDSVRAGKLHLRMIPIGAPDTDNERAGAVLIGTNDPLSAWDGYVAGDAAKLEGMPSAGALAGIRANHELIDKWGITNTPYLVYRAKDGKVKVLQGEPEKVALILTDMGL